MQILDRLRAQAVRLHLVIQALYGGRLQRGQLQGSKSRDNVVVRML